MAERAQARCPHCGTPIEPNTPCTSEFCASTRETLRPRISQPDDIRQISPSGTFQVHESERTTYDELIHSQSPGSDTDLCAEIPAEPRVPRFSHPPLDDTGSLPPTRRDLPTSRRRGR
jgi:hypothetical protein